MIRIKVDDILKFLTVFLCVIYKILLACDVLKTNSIQIYIVIIAIFAISIIIIFSKKMKKKDFYKLLIFITFGIVTILKIVSVNYIFPILIAINFYDKDNKEESIRKLIKYFFISLSIAYLSVIILNFVGVLPSHNLIRFKSGNMIIRQSLGFSHPAFVGLYFIFIVCAYFCLNKINKLNILITITLSFFIYKICDSRITFVCSILFVVMILSKNNKVFLNYIKKIIPYLFIFLTFFTIGATILFAKYKLNFIDAIFSNRLSIYNEVINNMNILRNPIGGNAVENIVLDNFYLVVFLYFGFIGYIIWALFYYISSKNLKEDFILDIIQIIILVYGLADSNVIVTSINFMISVQFLSLLYNWKPNNILENVRKGEKYG